MTSERARPPVPPEQPPEDEVMACLLRLAGPREAAAQKRTGRVRAEVRTVWRKEVRGVRRRRFVFRAAALAAAAALVLAVGYGWWRPSRPLPVSDGPIATLLRAVGSLHASDGGAVTLGLTLKPGSGLETGADGRAALALADGVTVRLDSDTHVRLLSGPVLRLDRGALYIDSGPGRKRQGALEIKTDLGLVRDIGTQFEVRMQGDELRLSVRDGIAMLVRDDRTFSAPAGTRLLVRPGGAVETGAVPMQGPDWDWVLAIAPPFELEGSTLARYLDWLARETGWRVEFADRSMAGRASSIVLHGSVAGIRPDETPAAVLPTCGFAHRLSDGTLTLERQPGAAGAL